MTYLALGDSYTIGEQVLLSETFPYQTVQMLRNKSLSVCAPEIIAKTGWTTDELSASMAQTPFLKNYDIVSLLIGVNNQYRGRSSDNYKDEFENLLKRATGLADDESKNVFVLSIPDWGITPFAKDRDSDQIAADIDNYNAVCRLVTEIHHCNFIDITTGQRKRNDAETVAADGLHPSANEYRHWAMQLSSAISVLHSS